jgi:hypothetical protein
MVQSHLPRSAILVLALSALGLLSACFLFAYLEVSPQSPTPLDALTAVLFPDSPTTNEVAVQAPPTFDFSEANLLLAWAVLTAIGALFALLRSLTIKVTSENAQPRAVAVVCSLLAGTCLFVLSPLLVSVYRVAYG